MTEKKKTDTVTETSMETYTASVDADADEATSVNAISSETVGQESSSGSSETEALSSVSSVSADSNSSNFSETAGETSGSETEVSSGNTADSDLEAQIAAMPLEEKIGQLFICTPDAITGVSGATEAGEATRSAISNTMVGGLAYFSANLTSPDQTRQMLSDTKAIYSDLGLPEPFLCVDEEGGTVSRIFGNPAFGKTPIPDMITVGTSGNTGEASASGTEIGTYLYDLGFNVDFAPVADVLTNPSNTVMAQRSFGSDPQLVSSMVRAESEALKAQGIIPVLKHYPGHGATSQDSHEGYASTDKSLDELMQSELVPFANAADYAPVIMVGHISDTNVSSDGLPATLSKTFVTDILRGQLGYHGLVITDAMAMGAIANQYSSDQAAVMAIEAGCDMILQPADFSTAYNGVLQAVNTGKISEERINESLRRILTVKEQITN